MKAYAIKVMKNGSICHWDDKNEGNPRLCIYRTQEEAEAVLKSISDKNSFIITPVEIVES